MIEHDTRHDVPEDDSADDLFSRGDWLRLIATGALIAVLWAIALITYLRTDVDASVAQLTAVFVQGALLTLLAVGTCFAVYMRTRGD